MAEDINQDYNELDEQASKPRKKSKKKKKKAPKSFLGRFNRKHPILFNALLMLVAACALVYVIMLATDIFTGHGQEAQVPDVRNLPLDEAVNKIEEAGFEWEISDSVFNDDMKPGIVISQEPKGNAYAKKVRTIFLKINAFNPKSMAFPVLVDLSMRQAQSLLKSMGYKNVGIDSVPSPYEGLVLGVKVNGHQVPPGTQVNVEAQIRLTVGDGMLDDDPTQIMPDQPLENYNDEQRRIAEDENEE